MCTACGASGLRVHSLINSAWFKEWNGHCGLWSAVVSSKAPERAACANKATATSHGLRVTLSLNIS